jgi:hypothetical protein
MELVGRTNSIFLLRLLPYEPLFSNSRAGMMPVKDRIHNPKERAFIFIEREDAGTKQFVLFP